MFCCACLSLKGSFPCAAPAAPVLCWPQTVKELASLSLVFRAPLPWGKRVQKYGLFPNWQALFSNIFHLFYILLTTREKKVHLFGVFPSFGSVFRGKNGSKGSFSQAFFGPTEVFLRQIWRKSGRDESEWEEDTLLYIIGSMHSQS